MMDKDRVLYRLACRLAAAREPIDLAEAMLDAGQELGLPVAMVFLADEDGQTLSPIPYQSQFVSKAVDFLTTALSEFPDMGGWLIDLGKGDLFTPLCQGRSITTDPAQGLPGSLTVGPGSFLLEFLPKSARVNRELGRQIGENLGLSALSLVPVGSEPLSGALLLAHYGDRDELSPDLLDAIQPVLEPAFRRVEEYNRLKEAAKETAAAGAVAQILARPRLTLNRRLQLCLEVILEAIRSETGSIMLLKGKKLRVAAATNPNIIGLAQSLDSDSVSAHVARTGHLLNVDDISSQSSVKRQEGGRSDYSTGQVLSAPILDGRKVVGVLNVTNRRDKRAFVRVDENQVAHFLDRISGLIARAALTESLQRERARLRKANVELKQLERFKQDLTNMVVHDLKGPLAEIVANCHMIQEEELSELGQECLDVALLAGDDLSRMIANLLDISRLNEGRLTLKLKLFDIREAIERVVARLHTILALKGIKVNYDLGPDLPLAEADPNIFERIIQNLLTNAVDHTPDDSQITFTAHIQGRMLVIGLADEGQGVPEAHRQAIFQMFTQLPDRDKPRTSTGLGLTFCWLAVQAHKGKIWVEEASSGGADFRFTLPVVKGESEI